jgi:hypothetical protein
VASYSGLPEPMLARSGRLPSSGDYSYEVKWDGFRAIVSTEGSAAGRERCTWERSPKSLRSRRLPMGYLGVPRW